MPNQTIQTRRSWMLSLSTLIIALGFSACSDTQKSDEKKAAATTAAPQIEIVTNDNAHEVKVKNKEHHVEKGNSYYYDYDEKSEYSQNAQPANEAASVRVRPRTQIDANMNVRSPYEEVQVSLTVRRLSKEFIVKCSACHNDYANGIIGPSLLGRDANYIYDKIAQFKSGQKQNPLMTDLIKMMDDQQIRKLAEEIYHFNNEINKMRK